VGAKEITEIERSQNFFLPLKEKRRSELCYCLISRRKKENGNFAPEKEYAELSWKRGQLCIWSKSK